MQPVYECEAEYLKGLVGIAKKSNIKLFNDRIEVFNKSGENVETLNFNEITKASYVKGGVFRIKTGEQTHVITFFMLPWRFFGFLGLMMSGASKKGTEFAQKLREQGLQIDTKLI